MGVRIGVIDVGSNTTRLLVASAERGGVVPIEGEKVRLSLGGEIERIVGYVSDVNVRAVAKAGIGRWRKWRARSRSSHSTSS